MAASRNVRRGARPWEPARSARATERAHNWKYDPTRDYLEPSLHGLELSAGKYRRLRGKELADGTLALASDVLGLELRLTGRGLRSHDPESGQDLPNLAETDEARRTAETRLVQEAAARRQETAARAAAEARVAELEALLRREHGSDPISRRAPVEHG